MLSYYESKSAGLESSSVVSLEDDNTEISEDHDFVVSDSESLVYIEGSLVSSNNSELEEPNSEYNDTAGVSRASEVTSILNDCG